MEKLGRLGVRTIADVQALSERELATVDEDGVTAVRPGAWRLIAGGSSPGARSVALGAAEPVETLVEIR